MKWNKIKDELYSTMYVSEDGRFEITKDGYGDAPWYLYDSAKDKGHNCYTLRDAKNDAETISKKH